MAHEEWDKEKIYHYTYEYHPGVGGSISKQRDGSDVKTIKAIAVPMTHAEVEEALRDD
jgi:hypothetical protein